MKIHIEYDVEVPNGNYCDECQMKYSDDIGTCCSYYDAVLTWDSYDRLKCPACLLACRESLMEG